MFADIMKKFKEDLKKYFLLALLILVLGLVSFYLKLDLPEENKEARMLISLGNGEIREFAGPVMADMTVLEALHSSSLGGGFELRYSIKQDGGVALAKIDGLVNPGNQTWYFYLNKKPIDVADIDKIKIKAGDLIEVKHK